MLLKTLVIVGLILTSHSLAAIPPDYAFFGIDLYGNRCKGGLYENTAEGLNKAMSVVLRNGPRMTQEQENIKLMKTLQRYYEIKIEKEEERRYFQ